MLVLLEVLVDLAEKWLLFLDEVFVPGELVLRLHDLVLHAFNDIVSLVKLRFVAIANCSFGLLVAELQVLHFFAMDLLEVFDYYFAVVLLVQARHVVVLVGEWADALAVVRRVEIIAIPD